MDAKELLVLIDDVGLLELVARSAREKDGWIQQTILRSLSLLAAAEANDGKTPETDAAEIKVQLGSDYALTGNVPYADCARLERQRNGLAAEVLRLKTMLHNNIPWVKDCK